MFLLFILNLTFVMIREHGLYDADFFEIKTLRLSLWPVFVAVPRMLERSW